MDIYINDECIFTDCNNKVIAVIIDIENNWWPFCKDHAIDELTNFRERGA